MVVIEHSYVNCLFEISTPTITKNPDGAIIAACLSLKGQDNNRITLTEFAVKSKTRKDLCSLFTSLHMDIPSTSRQINLLVKKDSTAYLNLAESIIEICIHDSEDKMHTVLFEIDEDFAVNLINISIIDHYNENLVMQALSKKKSR